MCLDDDPDPIANVAPGGARAPTSIGREAQFNAAHCSDGGPNYPPAKSAMSDPEERNGRLELKIEGSSRS